MSCVTKDVETSQNKFYCVLTSSFSLTEACTETRTHLQQELACTYIDTDGQGQTYSERV